MANPQLYKVYRKLYIYIYRIMWINHLYYLRQRVIFTLNMTYSTSIYNRSISVIQLIPTLLII